MPTTKRAGLPEFWVTKLSGLLIGDQACRFASWIQGHYQIEKRIRDGSNLVEWKATHGKMVRDRAEELKADGWTVRLESQNFFKLKGNVAIVSGKPDIIARKGDVTLVSDCKGGAILDKNTAQVVIYQVIVPMAWGRPDLHMEGEVVYPSAKIPVPWATADKLRGKLIEIIKELATSTKPDATPSEMECRFCDVRKEDCPNRFGEGEAPFAIETSEF
jgi:CRISPR/Cas system-associated exonuclease Cas4 (RecB family)